MKHLAQPRQGVFFGLAPPKLEMQEEFSRLIFFGYRAQGAAAAEFLAGLDLYGAKVGVSGVKAPVFEHDGMV